MTDTRDKLEIIQVLNRYGLAMDARRWDMFDTIFTPAAKLDYGWRQWSDLPCFKAEFSAAHGGFDATQHAMLNHLVEVSGDVASAFTYCSWRLIKSGTAGGDALFGMAWYDDDLVRADSGWRISRRDCRILWTEGNPAVTGAAAPASWDVLRDAAANGEVAYLERRHDR